MIVRGMRSAVGIAPPLVIARDEIDFLVDALGAALDDTPRRQRVSPLRGSAPPCR